MGFQVTVLPEERRVEVVYPPAPTALDVAAYTLKVRQAVDRMGGPFCCLVDQRQARAMDPELQRAVAAVTHYAQGKGLRRGARLVADAIAGMTAWRAHRDAGLTIPLESFTEREAALRWLYAQPL
jgi:hypothetical protein